jgi:hypothetical protein
VRIARIFIPDSSIGMGWGTPIVLYFSNAGTKETASSGQTE